MPDELELDYDLGRFIGLYCAEGAVHRGEVTFSLHEDGFELNIEFEREVPQEAIPVVVVDDLSEWAESDESAGAPRRRELR